MNHTIFNTELPAELLGNLIARTAALIEVATTSLEGSGHPQGAVSVYLALLFDPVAREHFKILQAHLSRGAQ